MQEQKIDVTPDKPTYEQLVERLIRVSNLMENVGKGLVDDCKLKRSRENTALMLKSEAKDVKSLALLAIVGK